MDGFDTKEIDKFAKELMGFVQDEFPKESKKFMRKQGNELKKVVRKNMKEKVKVNKKTGNLLKGLKRGKPYYYKGQLLSIRAYSNAPHAHLIEEGHRKVSQSGKELGFTKGKHIFKESEKEFKSEFNKNAKDFIDKVLGDIKC